jgi:hypothetical protein
MPAAAVKARPGWRGRSNDPCVDRGWPCGYSQYSAR